MDMFDCVAPTRMGRNATAFTRRGRLRLRNASMKDDPRPVEEGCPCPCCRRYCRGYLNHLFRVGEMLGPILLSLHNLTFYARLLGDCREAIARGGFGEFRDRFVSDYTQTPGDAER
jgi:queuine tRNA-ribosyltransferase